MSPLALALGASSLKDRPRVLFMCTSIPTVIGVNTR